MGTKKKLLLALTLGTAMVVARNAHADCGYTAGDGKSFVITDPSACGDDGSYTGTTVSAGLTTADYVSDAVLGQPLLYFPDAGTALPITMGAAGPAQAESLAMEVASKVAVTISKEGMSTGLVNYIGGVMRQMGASGYNVGLAAQNILKSWGFSGGTPPAYLP